MSAERTSRLAAPALVGAMLAACGGGTPGGVATDATGDGADGAPCTVTVAEARCHSRPLVEVAYAGTTRRVWSATPTGVPPSAGWPAVVLYQGTNAGPAGSWDVTVANSAAFGMYFQVALVARLVDAGFAVIQPEAEGGHYWYTNVPNTSYDTSPDSAFIPKLLAALADGTFGPIDTAHLDATGISSGGYMTSRMAVSYPGTFRALAIASASYATCLGSSCTVPDNLPADHPPTLFLHGEVDPIVPIATARDYNTKLTNQGIETKFVSDPNTGHAWIAASPDEEVAWFTSH